MDELYILARRVLFDALAALGSHREAIVLVGAQAIYQHVGEGDLPVAPYTTDADLAIDPAKLKELPPLELVLKDAGFAPGANDAVGVWLTHHETKSNPQTAVVVDLLVPRAVSPGQGRRAAKLRGHNSNAARIVEGLEGTLVDAGVMHLSSFDADDHRTFDVRVAGPAGLLVAKLFKIRDRTGSARESDKDALDVFRLLRGIATEELATRYKSILADERSREVSEAALGLLREWFATRSGLGVEMILRAIGQLADPKEISASCEILVADLLDVFER